MSENVFNDYTGLRPVQRGAKDRPSVGIAHPSFMNAELKGRVVPVPDSHYIILTIRRYSLSTPAPILYGQFEWNGDNDAGC